MALVVPACACISSMAGERLRRKGVPGGIAILRGQARKAVRNPKATGMKGDGPSRIRALYRSAIRRQIGAAPATYAISGFHLAWWGIVQR